MKITKEFAQTIFKDKVLLPAYANSLQLVLTTGTSQSRKSLTQIICLQYLKLAHDLTLLVLFCILQRFHSEYVIFEIQIKLF